MTEKQGDHAKKNEAAVTLGRLGGRKGGPARAAKLTAEQRSDIARRRRSEVEEGSHGRRGSVMPDEIVAVENGEQADAPDEIGETSEVEAKPTPTPKQYIVQMGTDSVQLSDPEREEHMSALEVVQAVERLNTESLTAIDVQMMHWVRRSRKKVEYLLPVASHFVSEMMRPLFEKIDAVQFTSMSRLLRVAQDYVERLLCGQYQKDDASQIASTLTEKYSDHGFVIDREEAVRIGLRCEEMNDDLADIIDRLSIVIPDNKRMLGVFGEQQEQHDDQA